MTQRWFGRTWGAPVCEAETHVATPAWEPCTWCRDVIMPDDQGFTMPCVGLNREIETLVYHRRCFMRRILPHGPDCPHCRGRDIKDHSPECQRDTRGFCTCMPIPGPSGVPHNPFGDTGDDEAKAND